MAHRMTVPAAQWKRGLEASRRLGEWLSRYEERARLAREGQDAPARPRRRRRPTRPRP